MDLVTESSRNVLGKLHTVEFLSIYPHSSVPCHNLHKNVCKDRLDCGTDFFSQLFKGLSYEITCPIPINNASTISRQVINGMDPALHLVKEKHFWEKQKTELLKYCGKNSTKKMHGSDLKPGAVFSSPLNVTLLADHFSKDPDEFLTNNYNVYYTRGNISSINIASDKYLLFPKRHGKQELLSISKIPERNQCMPDTSMEWSTGVNSPIFQIEVYESFLISRQRNRVCVFLISEKDDGTLNVKVERKNNNDIPYYSVALHKGMYCTTTADRHFDVFDINDGRSILNGIVESERSNLTDNWCFSYFIDENTLCFIDRSCICFVDLRCKTAPSKRWKISNVTEHCEEAYCGAKGSRDVQYITTSHQLLSLDSRAGFSQRWTHGVTHSPALLSLPHAQTGSDKIFIGSQISDSVVFIENNVFDDSNLSTSHPYLLPNLSDTFHMARFNGCCLGNTVASRFSMSLTGLCVMEDDSGMNLFRLTSTGDIFRQSLKKSYSSKEMELTDNDIERLDHWENDCEQLFSKKGMDCTVSKILDDQHIIKYLTSNKEYIEQSEKIDFTKVPWGVSKKELLSYCDYLSPKILAVWGLEDIEEWAPGLNEESQTELSSSDEEEEITEKVSRWLEKYKEEEEKTDVIISDSEENEEVILVDPDEPLDTINTSNSKQPLEHPNPTFAVQDQDVPLTKGFQSAGF